MNSDLVSSMSVPSYMAEMHNDALYYLDEGNRAENVFVKRRFHRSAITNFCTSAEAALSKLVYDFLKANESSLSSDKDIELLIILGDPRAIPPKRFKTIRSKIKTFEKLYRKTIPSEIKDPYIELTELRNKIIHYSSSYSDIIYTSGQVEGGANRASQILDDFLSFIFVSSGWGTGGFQKNRTANY